MNLSHLNWDTRFGFLYCFSKTQTNAETQILCFSRFHWGGKRTKTTHSMHTSKGKRELFTYAHASTCRGRGISTVMMTSIIRVHTNFCARTMVNIFPAFAWTPLLWTLTCLCPIVPSMHYPHPFVCASNMLALAKINQFISLCCC